MASDFGPDVPLRIRFGNALTSTVFRLVAGTRLADTQTGLRGYPPELLGRLLSVDGRRYEYELNLLLRARSADVQIDTVPIDTIYLGHNDASHFRPIVDSARIYWPLLEFSGSSVLAFVIDTVTLLVLHALTGSLPAAVTAVRYFALAAVLLPPTMRRCPCSHRSASGRWSPR